VQSCRGRTTCVSGVERAYFGRCLGSRLCRAPKRCLRCTPRHQREQSKAQSTQLRARAGGSGCWRKHFAERILLGSICRTREKYVVTEPAYVDPPWWHIRVRIPASQDPRLPQLQIYAILSMRSPPLPLNPRPSNVLPPVPPHLVTCSGFDFPAAMPVAWSSPIRRRRLLLCLRKTPADGRYQGAKHYLSFGGSGSARSRYRCAGLHCRWLRLPVLGLGWRSGCRMSGPRE